MRINLNSGVYLQIQGDLGKYNSIPIDTLIKISKNLQKLIFTIAKYDLPSDEPLIMENFIIELVGFEKGSAVPMFAYSPRTENTYGLNWQLHRVSVNEKFEKLIEISSLDNYNELKNLYPESSKRIPIVNDLYKFANDFNNSPVSIVDYQEEEKKFIPLYKINKFENSVKKELIKEEKIFESVSKEINEGVAKVEVTTANGKITKKIIDYYTQRNISLEYAPEVIVSKMCTYVLKYPLRCLFEKEDDFFVIQSEMLSIIGTGLTRDEAEESFSEEFDFIYRRFNSLDDEALTNHNKLIKSILNQIVDKIE
ncbi:MAG: hypothetical protein Q7J16_02350 [Candidatus Cloacimonadales bacterium]|nr:hypothetical protein [Candidatus Cloacimonadales bacterium]